MTVPTLVAFFQFLGLGIVFPQLPFQAMTLGASPQTVTFLLVADLIAVALLAPIWGRLSDRFGRKPILLAGLALSPVSYVMLAQAQTLEMMFLARLCSGAGIATISIVQAYIAAKTPAEERTVGMARINGAYALAFVVGPLIATASALGEADALYERIALLAAGLTAVSVPLAVVCLHDDRASGLQEPDVSDARSFLIARSRLNTHAAVPMAVLVSLTIVYAAMSATIGVWSASTLGWATRELSLAFAATGAAAAITQFLLLPRLVHHIDERALAAGGGALLFAGLVLLASWPTHFGAAAAMILMGAGLAAAFSSLQSLVSLTVSEDAYGALMGTMHSAVSLARILGPVLGGLCLANLGLSSPYIAGSILVFGVTALLGQAKHPPQIENAKQVRGSNRNAESSLLS